MITAIPPSRVLHEWEAINAALGPALKLNEDLDRTCMVGRLVSGALRVWRATGESDGYVAARFERAKRGVALVLCYVGGKGNGPVAMRTQCELIEAAAKRAGCSEVQCVGRKGWRRVLRDYEMTPQPRGLWLFRKAI